MTIKGGTNKACAACKYQRRRCSKECPLSPYFPADKPQTFSNAHRLFGVCNIMRILKQVQPDERDEAMKSIIFESDMRAKYPVHGCYGIIIQYQYMAYKAMEELKWVQMLLALCKEHHPLPLFPVDQCSLLPTTSNEFPIYHNHGEVSSFSGNLVYDCGAYIENNDIWMKKSSCSSGITHVSANAMDEKFSSMSLDIPSSTSSVNANAMESKSANFNSLYHNGHDISDYDTPFDGFDEDRQSFAECKDAGESGVESSAAKSSVKDATQHIRIYKNETMLRDECCF